MPPCTWMQSWVQRCAAAGASVAATAAANSKAVSVPSHLSRCLVDGAGGVPDRGGGPLGLGDHLGALVLDGLELTDRPAELLADLGVRRRGVGGPARDADRLGRQQRRHQGARRGCGSGCSARGRRRPRRRWPAHAPPAAAGRRCATGSISSWSASRTTHSSPLSMATGSTRTDACAAAGTARTSPRMTRSSPCRVAVRPESMA